MLKVNFDDYAEKYDDILTSQLEFFDSDNAYFSEYKVLVLKKLLTAEPNTILDFGCGVGRSTEFLKKHFSSSTIYGCDLSEKSLIQARERVPTALFLTPDQIEKSAMTFDVIFIACVFHHIPLADRVSVMKSIVDVCSNSGKIIIFEHNPYNPMTRYLVHRCPFDRDAILLTPAELKKIGLAVGIKNIRHHYTLFFPSQLRWLRIFESYLRFLPLGGQYVVEARL
ncbi:MAG: hypothetical protein A3F13_01190 [Gammaproteobacteria bacterium RIFCSPHIGHO2_12_FULL_40_19]|nr:MAG: hypothetical protein A3F13_01190 [Gammaproteobacteria bacterium RIFCSPHIGHO2_12_FULL_40_19]